MFRLKQLDDTPENIVLGTNYPADPTTLTPAMPFLHGPSINFMKAQSSRFTHMATSSCVFHVPRISSSSSSPSGKIEDDNNIDTQPRLLLVQRASTDSYPLYHEVPGGMADPTDPTILAAVSRELFEETGLRVKNVVEQVLPAETFNSGWHRRMKKWVKLVFVVEVEGQDDESGIGNEVLKEGGDAVEAVGLAHVEYDHGHAREDGDDEAALEAKEAAQKAKEEALWFKQRRILEAKLGVPRVKLDPKEHDSFFWATEKEVRERKAEGGGEGALAGGRELMFVRDEQHQSLLNAFDLYKKRIGKE